MQRRVEATVWWPHFLQLTQIWNIWPLMSVNGSQVLRIFIRCPAFTESHILGKGLRGLADNCHKLQHLSLDGCYQVNDPSIVRLATSCTQLTYLSLGLCSTVKDTSLKALATHCPRLAHLNLFGCAYISERGVARLVEALGPRDLNYLCIRGMLGVGQTFSERLVKDWPRMEVVHTFLPRPQRYAYFSAWWHKLTNFSSQGPGQEVLDSARNLDSLPYTVTIFAISKVQKIYIPICSEQNSDTISMQS